MKTSNKLLIALAAALIIMPILSIAIYTKLNYVDAGAFEQNKLSLAKLEEATIGYTAQKLDKNFNAINITGFKDLFLNIIVVNSNKRGVKFPENFGSDFISQIDEDGILQLTLKNSKNLTYQYRDIYIYSDELTKITANNLGSLNINLRSDSLTLYTTKTSRIELNSNFSVKNFVLTTTDSTDVDLFEVPELSLNANIIDTKFTSDKTSYNKLNIVSKGESLIQIIDAETNAKSVNINQLNLEVSGSGSVNLGNVTIKEITGKLSDETTVTAPYRYLKNLK